MRKYLTLLLLFIGLTITAQVSQRCPVCPPAFNGASTGWVLTDSSGHAVWKAVSTSGSAWELTGNTGTNPATNFIGNIDSTMLIITPNGIPNITATNTYMSLEYHTGGCPSCNSGNVNIYSGDLTTNSIQEILVNPANGAWQISSSDYAGANQTFLSGTNNTLLVAFQQPAGLFEVDGQSKFDDGTQGNGKVLTSDASGNASWQYTGGGAEIDSNTTVGRTVQLSVTDSTFIIKGSGTLTTDTLHFPTGNNDQTIDVIFHNAVTTIVYTGTGTTGLTPVTVAAGVFRRYKWKNGAWQ